MKTTRIGFGVGITAMVLTLLSAGAAAQMTSAGRAVPVGQLTSLTPDSPVAQAASAPTMTIERAPMAATPRGPNVIEERGSVLEVLDGVVAVPITQGGALTVRHQRIAASTRPSIDSSHLGVVLNHTLNREGYINGEIALKTKSGKAPSAAVQSAPGFKELTAGGVYLVTTRTTSEFIQTLRSLNASPELEWVEPMIVYGPAVNSHGTGSSGLGAATR